MLDKSLHWTGKWGRLGGFIGHITLKLLNDRQKTLARIDAVAHGMRFKAKISDTGDSHIFFCASIEEARGDIETYFSA